MHIGESAAKLLRHKVAEAGRVEDARHADHASHGKTGSAIRHMAHDIQRIGNYDHCRIRSIIRNVLGGRFDDFGIHPKQIHAIHSGLAGQTGGDDGYIAVGNGRKIAGSMD